MHWRRKGLSARKGRFGPRPTKAAGPGSDSLKIEELKRGRLATADEIALLEAGLSVKS